MEKLHDFGICVVGYDIVDLVKEAIKESGLDINHVNDANDGKLGNFRTLTIFCRIPENEVIAKRRAFMDYICRDGSGLMSLYEHGNWMKVYIFKRLSWQ